MEARNKYDKSKRESVKICCSMNLLSTNIKGGSNKVKQKRIAHLIQADKVDICFIQETKLTS